MGYWSTHPLGGDQPLDAQLYFYEELGIEALFRKYDDKECSKKEKEKRKEDFLKTLSKALETKLDKALEDEYVKDYAFIIPYTVAQHGLLIKNRNLAERLKNLIGDGGAYNRGYEIKESNIENGYNEFQSPSDFASQLKDNWEDIVLTGEAKYKDLSRAKGLFEILCEEADDRNNGKKPKLINIK